MSAGPRMVRKPFVRSQAVQRAAARAGAAAGIASRNAKAAAVNKRATASLGRGPGGGTSGFKPTSISTGQRVNTPSARTSTFVSATHAECVYFDHPCRATLSGPPVRLSAEEWVGMELVVLGALGIVAGMACIAASGGTFMRSRLSTSTTGPRLTTMERGNMVLRR